MSALVVLLLVLGFIAPVSADCAVNAADCALCYMRGGLKMQDVKMGPAIKQLEVLQSSTDVYFDATFKVVPALYCQRLNYQLAPRTNIICSTRRRSISGLVRFYVT